MTAGRKDQPISIERNTPTRSLSGGFIDAWAVWRSMVWAAVKAKASGREAMEDGRPNATFVVVFTVYNLPGLLETDRIIWNGIQYNIRGILREGDGALDLKIEAERGVAS